MNNEAFPYYQLSLAGGAVCLIAAFSTRVTTNFSDCELKKSYMKYDIRNSRRLSILISAVERANFAKKAITVSLRSG